LVAEVVASVPEGLQTASLEGVVAEAVAVVAVVAVVAKAPAAVAA
jgi:hypothetical protein